MEDEHIRIDDLSSHLDSLFKGPVPSAFYAVVIISYMTFRFDFMPFLLFYVKK